MPLHQLDQPLCRQGASLNDPHGLLRGQGSRVRHIRLESADVLDRPEIGKPVSLFTELFVWIADYHNKA